MKLIVAAALIVVVLPVSHAAAGSMDQEGRRGRFALGAQIGSPGAGLQAQFAVNDHLVLRGGYDALHWDRDDTYHGVDYEAEIDFQSPGAFVDLHPFRNAFFASAGAYFGTRKVDLHASPTKPVNIGGAVFTQRQVGDLKGRIDLDSTTPFLGLGYDNTFSHDGRWGLRLLVGAAFGDAPQVDLASSGGTLSKRPAFQNRLAEEKREIQADADDYKILPVVQIGLNYRF